MTNAFHKKTTTVTRIGDKMFDVQKLMQSLGLQKKKVDADGRLIEMHDKVKCIRISEFSKFEYRHWHTQ